MRPFRSVALILVTTLGCLSRPVARGEPSTKTNFTTRVGGGAIDKMDLLFMIDNSASMADKQALLAKAVPDLLRRFLHPDCVNKNRERVGVSNAGKCPDGARPEFDPISDIHIGVVSSSLGAQGGEMCRSPQEDKEQAGYTHNNDGGRLVNRRVDGSPVGEADPLGFLAWFPESERNQGKARPHKAIADPRVFESSFADLVSGVAEKGCGYEAQLESVFRFLIAPDPYGRVDTSGGRAKFVGIDARILEQRKAFLRPDSLVAIVLLTDEDDSNVDVASVGGTGFRFLDKKGLFSPTVECEVDPFDAKCTSCGLLAQEERPGRCQGGSGVLADERPNVRFHRMKRRFGVDPQYPIARYVKALTTPLVPKREQEHDRGAFAYTGHERATCRNPLFAANLPHKEGDELCDPKVLGEGPRTPDLVYFAVIGGVPNDLLLKNAAAPDQGMKPSLSEEDWTKILGKDPLRDDFSGADPRMVPSVTPRAGRPGPERPNYDAKDGHRDWNTGGTDLQYACTFALANEVSCTSGENCDCRANSESPLCKESDKQVQVRGKAYPTLRPLSVVRALGDQGIAASLCPLDGRSDAPEDALFGYRPAVAQIAERLAARLRGPCLPEALTRDAEGGVACAVLATLPAGRTCEGEGLLVPDPKVLSQFLRSEAERGEAPDASRVCSVPQHRVPHGGSCVDNDAESGWCYVTGELAGRCEASIEFSERYLRIPGVKSELQCIDQR